MPEDDPTTFNNFLAWLYDDLDAISGNGSRIGELVDLYVFADKVRAQICKTYVVNEVKERIVNVKEISEHTYEALANLAPKVDDLRDLVMSWVIINSELDKTTALPTNAPGFTSLLLKRMFEEIRKGKEKQTEDDAQSESSDSGSSES